MIKPEFREDVLEAVAPLGRLSRAPWSTSMISTRSRGQPSATATSAKAYWRAVDSLCSATCWGLDWRI